MLSCAACAGLVLLAPVLGLLDIPLSAADRSNNAKFNEFIWLLGRNLGLSTTGIFTPRLRAVSGSGALFRRLTAYMEDVISGKDAEFNCGLRLDAKWRKDLAIFSALQSWPVPNAACVSTSTEREKELTTKPDEAFEMAKGFARMQSQVSVQIVQDAGKEVEALFDTPPEDYWKFSRGKYQRCRLECVAAIRFRPEKNAHAQWYFQKSVSNAGKMKNLPDKQRYYISEWVGVNSNGVFIDPLPMLLRPWDGLGGEGNIHASEDPTTNRTKFATSFSLWGGRESLSGIHGLHSEDSPALKLALEKSEVAAGQATDALSASNIGILALPMALTVIPVTLLGDVSGEGMFFYAIITDVLTTVTFIVKGFELITTGSTSYAGQEVYYTDKSAGSDTVSGKGGWILAESYTTECKLVDLQRTGWIFIVVGFTMLLLGIFLEFKAQSLVSRWTTHSSLPHLVKADVLEEDMLRKNGVSGRKASKLDFMEKERCFLDSQVMSPPPDAYSPGSAYSSSSSSGSRLRRLSGARGQVVANEGDRIV